MAFDCGNYHYLGFTAAALTIASLTGYALLGTSPISSLLFGTVASFSLPHLSQMFSPCIKEMDKTMQWALYFFSVAFISFMATSAIVYPILLPMTFQETTLLSLVLIPCLLLYFVSSLEECRNEIWRQLFSLEKLANESSSCIQQWAHIKLELHQNKCTIQSTQIQGQALLKTIRALQGEMEKIRGDLSEHLALLNSYGYSFDPQLIDEVNSSIKKSEQSLQRHKSFSTLPQENGEPV